MPAEETPELTERERLVLQALVDVHIATAEPVGSKALAELPNIGVSAATIRNVLAALHEHGLIAQPHTSAGRVPTDRGLRYYVDKIVSLRAPTPAMADEIEQRIEGAGRDGAAEAALREATRVLARLSRHTALVISPPPARARVQHVELVRLRHDAVLLIVVSTDGTVQNRLLEMKGLEVAPAPPELDRLGHRLSVLLHGRSLEEGAEIVKSEIARAQAELTGLEQWLLVLSAERIAATPPGGEVHVEGAARLLADQEDKESVQRTQELLTFLEEHDRARALLEKAVGAPGLHIFIGEENPSAALYERGVVTATLGDGAAVGVLGVIGPRHLDYARVVPLVDLTARLVSRFLG